ncbi:hypothetical protein JW916_03235 [Candidatus Sumerlaeota bacterium]|nr:hypothetical protein [Candidatus Sumerlaeota bacterium]
MDERQNDYERWVQPIKRRMMQAVWRIVRDPDDAEDAFRQAMETIWRRWHRVRKHPNPPALMMTICINAAYDQRRSQEPARQGRRDDDRAARRSARLPPPRQGRDDREAPLGGRGHRRPDPIHDRVAQRRQRSGASVP